MKCSRVASRLFLNIGSLEKAAAQLKFASWV